MAPAGMVQPNVMFTAVNAAQAYRLGTRFRPGPVISPRGLKIWAFILRLFVVRLLESP